MIKDLGEGKIEIRDKVYSEDIAISSSGKIFSWDREGKKIDKEEMDSFLSSQFMIIVIGLGQDAELTVTEPAQRLTKEEDVILVMDDTKEAIKTFNKTIAAGKSIFGVFPLSLSS